MYNKIGIVSFFVFLLMSKLAFAGSFVSLDTRPGVKQPFWLIEKESAAASVILFAGGDGRINIGDSGIGKDTNFLVRNREKFADHALNVAVVDVPTDQEKLYFFRTSEKHAADIKAVIKFMREKYNKPVWLIGTSRGSTSAAAVASWLKGNDAPDGVVLTASLYRGGKRGESLDDIALEDITQPVLFVHNELDECKVTPADEIPAIAENVTNAKVVEMKFFSGGYTQGRKCKAQSYHGFLGIDDEVVEYIANWVKTH